MSYTFHHCQTHCKCPNVTGWYVLLEPMDYDLAQKLFKGIANLYYDKFGPHNTHLSKDEFLADIYNPTRLAARWYATVQKCMLQGDTMLVNSQGGLIFLSNELKIIETRVLDTLEWPGLLEGETITIARWWGGKHYYVCSNYMRVFDKHKYNTYEEAYEAALEYAPPEKIKSRC